MHKLYDIARDARFIFIWYYDRIGFEIVCINIAIEHHAAIRTRVPLLSAPETCAYALSTKQPHVIFAGDTWGRCGIRSVPSTNEVPGVP
jgi:hypothetical protein